MNELGRRIPKRWTETEDKILYDEARIQCLQVTTGPIKDWNRIATKLPGRTNKDCRKRWVNKVCGGLKKGAWDEEEDQRLREAVNAHGQKWTTIANLVGLRSPDQCAKRWQHALDPRLEHENWTSEEDELLLTMVLNYGKEWKFIQDQELPTRSSNEVKNRYTILSRRLGLNIENIENNASPSSDSPSADHSLAADWAFEIDGIGKQSPQAEHDNSKNAAMDWEESQCSPLTNDSWLDSINGDWLTHLASPVSNPPMSGISPLNTESACAATTRKNSIVMPNYPRPSKATSSRTLDVLHATTTSEWEGTPPEIIDPSEFPEIFRMGPGNSNWGQLKGNLAGIMDLQNGQNDLVRQTVKSSELLMGLGTVMQRQEMVGKVSLIVEQCDTSTFQHLLDMSKKLNGKAKLEIGM